MDSVRPAFLASLPLSLRSSWETWSGLEAALIRAEQAGVARFGALVARDAFAAHLGARTRAVRSDEVGFAHAEELYLTCAIAAGSKAAIAAFEKSYLSAVDTQVGRLRLTDDELDELRQALRHDLLLAEPDRPPRIVDYAGRGPLGAWLRVAAVRRALRLRERRTGGGLLGDNALADLASTSVSPELRYAFAEHGAKFRAALRASLRELEAEDQNLLRQHHLDELTLDQLAVLHRAHRTTIAYRLTRARERLWRKTREHLVRSRKLTDSDCDSLFRHARSHMAMSLRGLFD